MDTIAIRNLKARAIIGTLPNERKRKQPVIADILLHADLQNASVSDTLSDAPDYASITDTVRHHIGSSRFRLLERLGGSIAELCFCHPSVRSVDVTLTKPEALGSRATVSVTIRRTADSRKRRASKTRKSL
jgi:FolB domain-containing protein